MRQQKAVKVALFVSFLSDVLELECLLDLCMVIPISQTMIQLGWAKQEEKLTVEICGNRVVSSGLSGTKCVIQCPFTLI